MDNNKRKKEGRDEDVVDTLLRLPKKNLEKRIIALENEIRQRQRLSDKAISVLSTQRRRLKDELKRLYYLCQSFNGKKIKSETKTKIIRLDEDILKELIRNFKDISELNEKLLQTNEELEKLTQKLKLID